MALINEVLKKKKGIDTGENEGRDSEEDNVHGGSKYLNGTTLFGGLCCYCVGKSIHLLHVVFYLVYTAVKV